MHRLFKKFTKLLKLLTSSKYREGLKHGVAAAIEHVAVVRNNQFSTLLDIGANNGQFSLLVSNEKPLTTIIAFEPLEKPASKFRAVFATHDKVSLIQSAVGETEKVVEMNVSNSIDSSSLLEITGNQCDHYPGTHSVGTEKVGVSSLSKLVQLGDCPSPIFMKIDVQGYEQKVLEGCSDIIKQIDMIYVETSFEELYGGQALVKDIITQLSEYGFSIAGIYNTDYDKSGKSVQADILFLNNF